MSSYPVPPEVRTPCAKDPELHFSESVAAQEAAKNVCRGCPFRDPCAMWAITRGEGWGVWGAMDAAERERFRKNNRITVRRPPSIIPRSGTYNYIRHGTAEGAATHRRRYEQPCPRCAVAEGRAS